MGRSHIHKIKRLANLRKARATRCKQPLLPENYIPPQREPSPLPTGRLRSRSSQPIIEPEILSTDDQSNSSRNDESEDEYQEAQSNFLMSLKSLRAIIHNMVCKRCKGENGDMWPTVTNLKGFKVEITVT